MRKYIYITLLLLTSCISYTHDPMVVQTVEEGEGSLYIVTIKVEGPSTYYIWTNQRYEPGDTIYLTPKR